MDNVVRALMVGAHKGSSDSHRHRRRHSHTTITAPSHKTKHIDTQPSRGRAVGGMGAGPASSLDFFQPEAGKNYHASQENDDTEHRGESNDSVKEHRIGEGEEEEEEEDAHFPAEDQVTEKFRKRLGIKLYGIDVPSMYPNFERIPKTIPKPILGAAWKNANQEKSGVGKPDEAFEKTARQTYKDVRSKVLENIEQSAWTEPTPIQMQTIPSMLAGRDVLGVAPTGSGKTAAFMIPLILYCWSCHNQKSKKHSAKNRKIRALVLVPTRELADQIQQEGKRLSAGTGVYISLLTKSVNSSTHREQLPVTDILVCTPKRLQDTLEASPGQLKHLRHVVMDECDRMLEFGLVEQVDTILSHCSDVGKQNTSASNIQRCMFSATLPENLEDVSLSFLRDPVRIIIGKRGAVADSVEQKLLFVGREEGKLLEMRQMAARGYEAPMLVFVQSKERATELYGELYPVFGDKLDVIHSDRPQKERNAAVNKFRTGTTWVLIATDLLCRGIDVIGVRSVINFDFPQTPISYIHRVGRTGRAGMTGKAITFFTEEDIRYLRSIANLMRLSGCEVPEWMLEIKNPKRAEKKNMAKSAPQRKSISTIPSYIKRQEAHKRRMIKNSKEVKAQGKRLRPHYGTEMSSDTHQEEGEWTTVPAGGLVPE